MTKKEVGARPSKQLFRYMEKSLNANQCVLNLNNEWIHVKHVGLSWIRSCICGFMVPDSQAKKLIFKCSLTKQELDKSIRRALAAGFLESSNYAHMLSYLKPDRTVGFQLKLESESSFSIARESRGDKTICVFKVDPRMYHNLS